VFDGLVEASHAQWASRCRRGLGQYVVGVRGLGQYVVGVFILYPIEGDGEVADKSEAGTYAGAAQGFGEVLGGDVEGQATRPDVFRLVLPLSEYSCRCPTKHTGDVALPSVHKTSVLDSDMAALRTAS